MWKAVLIVAALVASFAAPAVAQNGTAREQLARAHAAADPIITPSHITRLRATLRLTPAQQAYWAPVEVALSELARQQARGEAAGFASRFTDRSAITEAHLRRIKAIAMPLIYSLDDNQKRDAVAFGRAMGLQHLVAAF